MKAKTPVSFSHVGITVPDLEKGIKFYTEAMGWYHISGPIEVKESDDNNLTRIAKLIYGKGWKSFQFAHLSNAEGVGFELFEFAKNDTKESTNVPFKTGIHHFCLQHPDPAALLQEIVKAGGSIKMEPQVEYPDEKPYLMAFAQDPFGNIIEIYSHSYELHNVGPDGPVG
ncbi:Catechol 2,3-dioxygenase [Nonlabens sp. Hel1_33_55]|uniref:VOC family protein n=1 Tax=Nonlabens sp. Hel1_33_55 TaxID=1336802 RepID=UPI000875D891|nr:VOC family protein [Nonlabens sp. Hel1_33_55]SCY19577.1 Catechol 2,3-dioxygenase [Nonlabens sp. Hel1_33_55]